MTRDEIRHVSTRSHTLNITETIILDGGDDVESNRWEVKVEAGAITNIERYDAYATDGMEILESDTVEWGDIPEAVQKQIAVELNAVLDTESVT